MGILHEQSVFIRNYRMGALARVDWLALLRLCFRNLVPINTCQT